jgi:hypothetical protein
MLYTTACTTSGESPAPGGIQVPTWHALAFTIRRRSAGNLSSGAAFTSLTYSADGSMLFAGGRSKYVCVYDVAEKVLLRRFQVSGSMRCLCFAWGAKLSHVLSMLCYNWIGFVCLMCVLQDGAEAVLAAQLSAC